jgi:hypothetical protein
MLRFTTLIAVSLAVATPALAAPPMEYGESDGVRFGYTTELRANGFIHIAGVMLGSKEPFVLDVSPKGQVDGKFGDVAVEYSVSTKVRDAVVAQLDQGRAIASAK